MNTNLSGCTVSGSLSVYFTPSLHTLHMCVGMPCLCSFQSPSPSPALDTLATQEILAEWINENFSGSKTIPSRLSSGQSYLWGPYRYSPSKISWWVSGSHQGLHESTPLFAPLSVSWPHHPFQSPFPQLKSDTLQFRDSQLPGTRLTLSHQASREEEDACFPEHFLVMICMHAKSLQLCRLFVTVACQAPLYRGFSSQDHWSWLPCTLPGDLPDPGIKSMSLILPALAGRDNKCSAYFRSVFGSKSGT